MRIKILIALFLLNCYGLRSQAKVTVFFDFNRHDLNENAIEKLNGWISEGKDIEVTKIYGFCDWKGSNIYNDTLSVKRVNAVFNYLKGKNINVRNGYEIRGFGEDFEQSKVQSENRKVTIVYETKIETAKPNEPVTESNIIPVQELLKTGKPGDKIRLNNIQFFNMTPRILPRSKPILFEVLCALQDNPKLKIEIQGHICCQLTNDLQALSVARAKAVYNFLVSNQINRKRLSFKGFGTTNPIHPIPEKSEKEEQENRRVEIVILEN